tara:strand:+ start:2101 stop:2823 length:723 start_codon:yes stop_codon:yes gene_type:complete
LKNTFLLLVFQFVTVICFAQGEQDSIVRIDTSSVLTMRQLDDNHSKKYIGEEFNYTTKTGESQNLLARFISWVGKGLYRIFGIELSPQLVQALEYLIYFLLVILAIYLMVKVLINEKFNSIFNKKAKSFHDINLTEDHIETIDVNNLLCAAIESDDYRLAIRYQFLLTLQKLSKNDIIQWHFDKTNSDYLMEIIQPNIQQGFKKVTYLYDYIWYGEQTIDLNKYEKSVLDFESINKLIKL